jgi:hypothetical protein
MQAMRTMLYIDPPKEALKSRIKATIGVLRHSTTTSCRYDFHSRGRNSTIPRPYTSIINKNHILSPPEPYSRPEIMDRIPALGTCFSYLRETRS